MYLNKLKTPLYLLLLIGLVVPTLAEPPKRAMVLVFDQMRAEYIDRFDMKNFKRARSMGVEFSNGIVGHLESNTIVSHPVIMSGKLPKNLPWGTHVMKDTKGYLGKEGEFYSPFLLKPQKWLDLHLQSGSGLSSIASRIKKKHGGPAFAVAQKKYAAVNYGGPFADTIVYLGSAFKEGPFKGLHRPQGRNVPKTITQPVGNRFYIDSTNDWGSGQQVYPFHGNSFITGSDPKRPGGDRWVGDVVQTIMEEHYDWSLILASFGTIDKVSHVLAEHDEPTSEPWALANNISLKNATQKADVELGRILDRLAETGLDKETAIIITADHGGQHSRHFHGRRVPNAHIDNLYFGLGRTKNVPPAAKPLMDTGLVEVASMNTLMLCWTKALNRAQHEVVLQKLSATPGVCEVYRKEKRYGNYRYRLLHQSAKLQGAELNWANEHHQDLVDSLASDTGPEYIGLFFDRHGYDVPGSHGGAQEMVQRIPYLVISPNLRQRGQKDQTWVRLVDVNPILGELMNLDPDSRLDGSSDAIKPHL